MYLQHMLLIKRKTVLKFTFIPSIISVVFASFEHLKLPISIKIPVTLLQNCLYLHDSYISKFEFMNYLFANLLVTWLYSHMIDEQWKLR